MDNPYEASALDAAAERNEYVDLIKASAAQPMTPNGYCPSYHAVRPSM